MDREEICGNCKHHCIMDDWVCTNEESDYYGIETGFDDTCEDFEERE